jgi:hypothetical protein
MEKISRKIKILVLVTVTMGAMVLAAIPSTLASDSDTFNLSVKGYYIGLTIDRDSWNVDHGAAVEMSSNYQTNSESNTFTANTSQSSVNLDVKLQITTDGATWHAATGGQNAGADKYKLSAGLDLWLHQVQIVTTSVTTIKSDMTPGT